jgi:hypothetical protein
MKIFTIIMRNVYTLLLQILECWNNARELDSPVRKFIQYLVTMHCENTYAHSHDVTNGMILLTVHFDTKYAWNGLWIIERLLNHISSTKSEIIPMKF